MVREDDPRKLLAGQINGTVQHRLRSLVNWLPRARSAR
jgi:hypothetical protein